jgi:tetratricopeptide (TPR) repeat protein
LNPAKVAVAERFAAAQVDYRLGDFGAARRMVREIEALPDYAGSAANSCTFDMLSSGWLHDTATVARLARIDLPADPANRQLRFFMQITAQSLTGDARGSVASYRQMMASPIAQEEAGFIQKSRNTTARAFYAKALAQLGDFNGAEVAVRGTPPDCDACMLARGEIAAMEKQWDRAAFWFAAAGKHAPSIPFTDEAWGRMLLAKDDADGAIAKFEASHRKGPHFADPLEGWGEALIAKNRSDLALAKFEEANKYAPDWNRLHQKWGEALRYVGRKDEAAKQFALARSPHG